MGLFGGGSKSAPVFHAPDPPQYETGEELFEEAVGFGQREMPLAYGARETGLGRIGAGEYEAGPEFYDPYKLVPETPIGPEYFRQWGVPVGAEETRGYFGGFGPTSFEEALGAQQFKNIMPDIERAIMHRTSLAGLGGTTLAGEMIGRERGRVGVDIGQYLSELGQRRAMTGLEMGMGQAGAGLTDIAALRGLGQQRAVLGLAGRRGGIEQQLGIDPYAQILGPYAGVAGGQANLQTQADYQAALQASLARYQQDIAGAERKKSRIGTIGSLAGAGLGIALAPFTAGLSIPAGAALGGALGGQASTLFGGAGSPISMQDALSIAGMFPGAGAGTAQPVFPGQGGGGYQPLSLPTGGGGLTL